MTRGKFRKLGAALVTGVAALALAACSGGGGTSSGAGTGPNAYAGQTLTLALSPLSGNADGYKKFYGDVATAFKKATGATLKIEYTVTSESVETQMIDRAAVARSGPDMIFMGTTVFPTAYYSNAFASLSADDWKQIGGTSQFYPNMLSMSGPDASHYAGIPLYNVPHAMVYNTSLFKQAGITSAPKTWSQYIADGQKINDPSKGIYGTGMDPADSTDPWKTLWYFAKQYGSDYVSKDNKTATINSKPVNEATTFWMDWNAKYHIVDPSSTTWQSSNMLAAFAQGKIGELPVQSATDVPLFDSGKVGKNFAFAPVPSVPYGMSSLPAGGEAPGTFVAGDGVAITKYAPMPLALQFLKVWLSTPIQLDQYKLTGSLPVTTAAGAKVKAMDPAVNGPFIDSLKTQQPTPFVAAWGTVEEAMASVSSSLAAKIASNGQLTPDQVSTALKGANSSVQDQL